jgi:DNA/RNA endonuclease G (NUC1)
MALLETEGLPESHPALQLTIEAPEAFAGQDVAVIGYPAFDPRNNVSLQNRIFRGVFNVKRLQPGTIVGRGEVKSYESRVNAMTHDASTLGGNSGSVVLHVGSGQVVALHFAGRYLEANYAVPASELAKDRHVVAAGVVFEPNSEPVAVPWEDKWLVADPGKKEPAAPKPEPSEDPSVRQAAQPTSDAASLVIPLEVSLRLGAAGPSISAAGMASSVSIGSSAGAQAGGAVEAAVEPFHEDTYDNREGYDEDFLGIPLEMPEVADLNVVSKLDDGEHRIPYHHFSLVMHKERRLAIFTAANVDARPERKEPEAGKDYTRDGLGGLRDHDTEKWFLDPRIPGIHQLPDKFFTKDRKAFDKGHIVRRDDVAWGSTYEEVRRANGDTFHVTNCSPQVLGFNRSARAGLWGKLENLILKEAATERLVVFGGPVLDDENDRVFQGVDDQGSTEVQIPSRYWKVVVARKENLLESFGFLLEQNLDEVDFEVEFALPTEWRQRMVRISELQEILGNVCFPDAAVNSDQFENDLGESVRREGQLG